MSTERTPRAVLVGTAVGLLLTGGLPAGSDAQILQLFPEDGPDSVSIEALSPGGEFAFGYSRERGAAMRVSEFGVVEILGIDARILDVSADGETFLTHSDLRTASGAVQHLESPEGAESSIWAGMSDDATVVVGLAQPRPSASRAVSWREGEARWLEFPEGYEFSEALGVSADGRVVFGSLISRSGITFVAPAVEWRDGAIRILPRPDRLAGADLAIRLPLGASRDGSLLAGLESEFLGRSWAVRWRSHESIVIPSPGGRTNGRAFDISADGVVVLAMDDEPFVWDPSNGSRYVADLLAAHGVEVPERLPELRLISDDGLTLAGEQAFVRLPAGTFPSRPERDADVDLIPDELDNCVDDYNPAQSDADSDGFGNACDADYDNDGSTGMRDFLILFEAWKTRAGDPNFDAAVDCDDNGRIGNIDLRFFQEHYGKPQSR